MNYRYKRWLINKTYLLRFHGRLVSKNTNHQLAEEFSASGTEQVGISSSSYGIKLQNKANQLILSKK